MKHQVHVVHEQPCDQSIGDLPALAQAVLVHEKASAGSLSIVLTSEEKQRDLNRRFAQIDQSTDVLAFGDGSPDPESGSIYYGDVTIALPIAVRQAKQAGHSLATELALLTVHGVLHLLGHDHYETAERSRMRRIQAKILRQFGHSIKSLENNE